MEEDIKKLLEKDSREKKQVGVGIFSRATRLGRIGKMLMPSDLSKDKTYKKSSKTVSYNIREVLKDLQGTPTLKKVLLEKMDLEYENYRIAIGNTLDAVGSLVEEPFSILYQTVGELVQIVSDLDQEVVDLQEQIRRIKLNRTDRESLEKEIYQSNELKEVVPVETVDPVQEKKPSIPDNRGISSNNLNEEGRKEDLTEKILFGKIRLTPNQSREVTDDFLYSTLYSMEQAGIPITVTSFRQYFPDMISLLYNPNHRQWVSKSDFDRGYKLWKMDMKESMTEDLEDRIE